MPPKSASRLDATISAYISRHAMLAPGDRVAVAVSGGSDSVALLHFLAARADDWGLQLAVAHVDHRWRDGSGADAAFVAALARRLDLPFFLARAPLPLPRRNIEQNGRRLRYAFFHQLVRGGEVNRVATAHTADDQAETVLLRLLRGAGTRGLAGIWPVRALVSTPALAAEPATDLVRPLLRTTHLELQAWLRARGEGWREDPSNQSPAFTRNRVRQLILPLLGESINPAVVAHLGDLAAIAQAEEQYWRQQVRAAAPRIWQAEPGGGWCARRDLLAGMPLALRRRLLLEGLRMVASSRDAPAPASSTAGVTFQAVDQLLQWLDRPPSASSRHRRASIAGVELVVTAHQLFLGGAPSPPAAR